MSTTKALDLAQLPDDHQRRVKADAVDVDQRFDFGKLGC